MNEKKLIELIEKNNGFQICLGFRDDVDHFVGGTGDTIWYFIQKKSDSEFWKAVCKDGKWTDKHYTIKKKDVKEETAESGLTEKMVTDRLYFGQDYIEKDGRKPTVIEQHGMMVEHYTYKFGELAYEISQEYGVTVSYSNINDEQAGFSVRDIVVGKDVKAPNP